MFWYHLMRIKCLCYDKKWYHFVNWFQMNIIFQDENQLFWTKRQNVKKRSKFGDFLRFEQGTQSLYMSSERMLHLLVWGFMTNVWLFHYKEDLQRIGHLFELCWSRNIYYGPGMRSENTCKNKNTFGPLSIFELRFGSVQIKHSEVISTSLTPFSLSALHLAIDFLCHNATQ